MVEKFEVLKEDGRNYPLGVTPIEGGMHFSTAAPGDSCALLLYRCGHKARCARIGFPESGRTGDVWEMSIAGDFSGLEYQYEVDGRIVADEYGRQFSGRERWGSKEQAKNPLRAILDHDSFDWEDDRILEIPYEACIIYRIHTRGFTRHPSSKVADRGTFNGIVEKIPYIKDLGVTTIELMPPAEFQEVMMKKEPRADARSEDDWQLEPTGKLNYWGYGKAMNFAPKASYCSAAGARPVVEFKRMVKELHKAGLELIVELFFTGEESPSYVLDVARYWAREFHVDGIHVVGPVSRAILGEDPYLSRIKLFADSWDGVKGGRYKHLADYNDGFLTDMRRLLKGDEGMINSLTFRSRHNPADRGAVNYMANTNGFTLMDMVSYEVKHNESNGEDNCDGSDYNFTWNCGIEGASRRKKVFKLRRRQLRNAILLLFLSQGTPLIMAGDEFGNTQYGNNNAYCQDNETAWLNWNQAETNRDIREFVKQAIHFRKNHPVFCMKAEPRLMDYLACGHPDMSFHGVRAWCPEFENFRRQLGIMYCGRYARRADGSCDDYFFVMYNFHWEPHFFALPNLPQNLRWHVAVDTGEEAREGYYPEQEERLLEDQKQYTVLARSIVVLVGRETPESRREAENQQAVHNKKKKKQDKIPT